MTTLFDTLLQQHAAVKADWKELATQFHRDNPKVYELFKRFTFEAIAAGHEYYSADMIMHRVRWETSVATADKDCPLFKINNNYVAHYARMFMAEFPQYDGLFRTRSLHD